MALLDDGKHLPTGVPGLDDVLQGGLHRGRVYLVSGEPGTGKTTLGLQFLLEGVKAGERTMMLNLIESRDELLDVADSHGWSLEGIELIDVIRQAITDATAIQTVFEPGEVEFGELTRTLVDAIRRHRPERLVLDSVSQLTMMVHGRFQLIGQILEIRQLLQELGCTALFTSSGIRGEELGELETIVHGSISLSSHAPAYGQSRRELLVKKMRGGSFATGYHNFRIRTGGIEVYTWPRAARADRTRAWETISSGISEVDEMLGGGLERGTACLVSGTTGTGKSTLASVYVQAAARRGERALVFCFDERSDTFLRRCDSLGMDIRTQIADGLVDLVQIDAGEMSPGEFAQVVRRRVEERDAKVVVIDSLTGYLNAMPEDRLLLVQLHELLNYLGSREVLSILVKIGYDLGQRSESELDASYISDTIIYLRHFEAFGRMRNCMSVIKKRHGSHEKNIREFRIERGGCRVGEPLSEFSGVLSGNPVFLGGQKTLFEVNRREERAADER